MDTPETKLTPKFIPCPFCLENLSNEFVDPSKSLHCPTCDHEIPASLRNEVFTFKERYLELLLVEVDYICSREQASMKAWKHQAVGTEEYREGKEQLEQMKRAARFLWSRKGEIAASVKFPDQIETAVMCYLFREYSDGGGGLWKRLAEHIEWIDDAIRLSRRSPSPQEIIRFQIKILKEMPSPWRRGPEILKILEERQIES